MRRQRHPVRNFESLHVHRVERGGAPQGDKGVTTRVATAVAPRPYMDAAAKNLATGPIPPDVLAVFEARRVVPFA